MLDRIDIHVEVPRVEYEKLSDDRLGESSIDIQQRVETARKRQQARFADDESICNAEMGLGDLRKYCGLDAT
jgi:magnesium chelatase family protein